MFIVIEGTDGCGKGTQTERLVQRLGAVKMKSPDRTTAIGMLLDRWLKGEVTAAKVTQAESAGQWVPVLGDAPETAALALQAIMLANKAEVQRRIANALRANGRVVMDRYAPSAIAYGSADGLDPYYLSKIHTGLIEPDASVLIDVSVATSMQRIASRIGDDSYGRVEERIRCARLEYRILATNDRWITVDGERSPIEVENEIVAKLRVRGFNIPNT